ncbi:hypothetical protein FRB93_000934 [Tulasnella sp. JGI-2019a]|nr:hypothetical protein FRB93_000934 [Tulasnella sp. JGI-2019a]
MSGSSSAIAELAKALDLEAKVRGEGPRTPALEDPQPLEEGYIDIPALGHTDLLIFYNTIQNAEIPAPLGHVLTTSTVNGKGLNPVRKDHLRDRRTLAIKEWEESDEDEDGDGSKQVFIPSPPQSLKALKEAAAEQRETNPSSLTVAAKEAEARIEAARKARSEQLEKIKMRDNAIKMLNK